MSASPRISVLGEGGDLCTVGNGPSFYSGDGFPFTDCYRCVWAWQRWRSGLWTPSCCSRKRFLVLTCYYRKSSTYKFLIFSLVSFCHTCISFCLTYISFCRTYISFRLFLQPFRIFSWLCQEKVFFHIHTFCHLFSPQFHFTNWWEQNPKVTGCHSSGSSMTIIMMRWMLFTMFFFLMFFTWAWSPLEASTV